MNLTQNQALADSAELYTESAGEFWRVTADDLSEVLDKAYEAGEAAVREMAAKASLCGFNEFDKTLELAALACGKQLFIQGQFGGDREWQPHLPTTQGKADLLDMMLATSVSHVFRDGRVYVWKDGCGGEYCSSIELINGNKHVALAEATLKVAAMVGEKIKGTPC